MLTAGERAILVRIFMCMHHLETGRIPEATRSLDEAETLFEDANVKEPPDYFLDLAFFNAVCKRDVTRAEHWWNRWEALGQPNRDTEYWAALASIRWLRGDHEGATEALTQGGAVGQNLPSAGAYEFERWRIEYVREAMSSAPMTVEQAQ
ncbi:MAG: hypothetical protein ACKV22_04095 [Bryobacteraceae bacterium]